MTHPLRLLATGMHRSGTSLVASLLAAWNVRMGDRLLGPDRNNIPGHFEDVDFLDLDRRMLAACTPLEPGHRDWGWTESGAFDTEPLAAYRDEASSLVIARDRVGEPWGWKDPRTSMLLDFWDEVLGHDARFLLVYRHPWEVADSMLRTGAEIWLTHPDYPARIWTAYNRRILDFHRAHRDRTLLVSTNRLLRDRESFAAAVRERFGIEADANAIATLHEERLFVSRSDDDPLPRLWNFANAEAMELLGELDEAADLGNDRRWETAARKPVRAAAGKPRLSVILPCHDDGDYVIDAVASVERNAPAETELIVVDDGSAQPRTLHVLAALRAAGHRVIEQPHSGLSAARNRGIEASSGDYLLPLDADNRLLPGFAAEAMAVLDADSAAGVVYGDRREFGARTGDIAVPEFDLARMLWSNDIDACAVLRRKVWRDAGGYDVAFTDWEDWDLWLGAAEHGWRFVRLPRPTFEYRIRPDSLHQRFLRGGDSTSTLRRIHEKHRALVTEHASPTLAAAHVERRQLLDDAASLRASRDSIQAGAHAQIAELQHILAARDEELDSVKFVLQARDRELAARKAPQSVPAETALSDATRVFTIVARNYLAHARVLAASLSRHNPGARLHVFVLDDPDGNVAQESSFEILRAHELPFDPSSEFHTMAAIYDVTEMATAVKPWIFAHLFARGAAAAIYLDPDIEVFDALGEVEQLARVHGIVLTPHITESLPQDGKRPDERDLLLAGIYNLGFLALSAQSAAAFLPWWQERLRRHCVNDPAAGFFVDQRWIDFVPALFAPYLLKDPGYNVAYWNLPHRELTRDGERILANGRPLRFFHFSGFSPRVPHLLSKHQDALRIRLSENPLLAELCERYATALENAGFADVAALPYGFATAGSLPLDARTRRVLRRTYLEDEASGGRETSFPNPFSAEGVRDVIERLTRPSPHAPAVPAWLGEIWSERADLRIAFPRIESVDAGRFLDWVRTQGVREHDIPSPLVPPKPLEPKAPVAHRRKLTPGVNVYGYAFAESGTGQIVRSVAAALAADGIPYAVVPFTNTVSRQQRDFRDLGTVTPMFDTNLICVNADQVPSFFENMRGKLPATRTIGLWAWEVEDLPPAMAASESPFDEVWGISSFTATSLSRALTKPVRAFPLPVIVPEVRRRTRAELEMPEGFLFLFAFDYDSVFRRKNPLAVVAAFRMAFGDRTDVALFIKTTNAARHAAEDEALRAAARGCANIVIRDAYVTSDEYFSMLDACDCYVSLHRSEGFGLTVAEAMALGKPVLSTAYSATLEFANGTNSFPVPARIVAVGAGAPPYPRDSRWADPDVAAAAQQMRRVYDDRDGAAAMGARARADIETLHGAHARGTLLRQLLDDSRRAAAVEVPIETIAPSPSPVAEEIVVVQPTPTEPMFEREAAVAESLLVSPRPDLPSRLPHVTNPLRRFILRCMRVYWVQQLGIDQALIAAMRALHRESRSETARMREELNALAAEVRTLQNQSDRNEQSDEPRSRASRP